MTRGKKVLKRCKNCGGKMMVRVADVKRGWGKFCSKSCKAKEQTRRAGFSGHIDDTHPFSDDAFL